MSGPVVRPGDYSEAGASLDLVEWVREQDRTVSTAEIMIAFPEVRRSTLNSNLKRLVDRRQLRRVSRGQFAVGGGDGPTFAEDPRDRILDLLNADHTRVWSHTDLMRDAHTSVSNFWTAMRPLLHEGLVVKTSAPARFPGETMRFGNGVKGWYRAGAERTEIAR